MNECFNKVSNIGVICEHLPEIIDNPKCKLNHDAVKFDLGDIIRLIIIIIILYILNIQIYILCISKSILSKIQWNNHRQFIHHHIAIIHYELMC